MQRKQAAQASRINIFVCLTKQGNNTKGEEDNHFIFGIFRFIIINTKICMHLACFLLNC